MSYLESSRRCCSPSPSLSSSSSSVGHQPGGESLGALVDECGGGSLCQLSVIHWSRLSDLSALGQSPRGLAVNLRSLKLSNCARLRDLAPLTGLRALETLHLTANPSFVALPPLRQCARLHHVNLR